MKRAHLIAAALLVSFLIVCAAALAATATFSTGGSCTYQALAIDPAGNVTVTCAGAPPQESCEAFVARMYTTYRGTPPSGGEEAWWVEQCRTGAQTRAQIEAAFIAAFPPTTPVTPPGPVGCNPSAAQPALAWGEVRQQRASSGQVMAFPLNQPEPAGRASLTFTQGQQPATPAGAITEFTVSTCPGVIDPGAGACYYRGPFVNNNTLDVYRRDVGAPGCLATNAAATYYVNVRWTFDACPFGACGFSLQWAPGPW